MTFSTIQKVAHRGGAALAPENTLAAFRHALTLPVDAIELDVQMSRDGHAVVFHDETVERLTDGQGNLLDLDLAYLRSLNAAAHFPGGWPDAEVIPTLTEVLTLVRQSQLQVYIELKPARRADGPYQRYPGIAEATVQEVLAQDLLDRVLFISFDWTILPIVKQLAPMAQTGALISKDVWPAHLALPELLAQVQALQCDWINLEDTLFTPDLLVTVHDHRLRLGLWTVNKLARMQQLTRSGVDSLTTDRPDLFADSSEDAE
jgi:glycerophosphoryl diester phosphodiesterase